MKNLNLAIAVAAGLAGGTASHFIWPQAVQAQSKQTAPVEVRAQKFVLVDFEGAVIGTFATDSNQTPPRVYLRDKNGREVWSAGGTGIHPASRP